MRGILRNTFGATYHVRQPFAHIDSLRRPSCRTPLQEASAADIQAPARCRTEHCRTETLSNGNTDSIKSDNFTGRGSFSRRGCGSACTDILEAIRRGSLLSESQTRARRHRLQVTVYLRNPFRRRGPSNDRSVLSGEATAGHWRRRDQAAALDSACSKDRPRFQGTCCSVTGSQSFNRKQAAMSRGCSEVITGACSSLIALIASGSR